MRHGTLKQGVDEKDGKVREYLSHLEVDESDSVHLIDVR